MNTLLANTIQSRNMCACVFACMCVCVHVCSTGWYMRFTGACGLSPCVWPGGVCRGSHGLPSVPVQTTSLVPPKCAHLRGEEGRGRGGGSTHTRYYIVHPMNISTTMRHEPMTVNRLLSSLSLQTVWLLCVYGALWLRIVTLIGVCRVNTYCGTEGE